MTVVGVEQAVVQDNASNVERTQNPVNPGDNVTLAVDTEMEDENATTRSCWSDRAYSSGSRAR